MLSNIASNRINKFESKISRKGAVRAVKVFPFFFFLNEDMNDINKSIKSLKNSNVLIDGVTETVQYEIKGKTKQKGGILPTLFALSARSKQWILQ